MAELRTRLENALRGRYVVDREVGRGGMAVVYLAHDLRHDRDVALKVLRPELAATLGADRFLQEIKLAAGLGHPHILPLHDSGDADGCLYYVMPFVTGESLRDRLEHDRELPLAEALRIAREVADALDYAHRAGIVHRDIKPENILLQDGHAVVADFGIARAISAAGARRVTAIGTAVGTPDYMSPEQAAGSLPVDGRSDIYSLGCVLFEMLAGQPPAALTPPEGPWSGPQRPRDRLTELAALRPSVPAEVAAMVGQMLAIDPADRFQTAAELADALAAPAVVWTPRSLAARRRRLGVGIAAVATLAVVAIVLLPKLIGAAVDPSLYVVLPFGHRNAVAPLLLDGDQCEAALYDAFGRWSDVRVVGELQAHEAWQQQDRPRSRTSALNVARKLGAGVLVWGELWGRGDSVFVRAGLYDVARQGATLIEREAPIANGNTDLGATFNALADSLLLGRARVSMAIAGARGTRLLAAWQAYETGHAARMRWDLLDARSAFRRAVDFDPSYPHANLWLAEVMNWLGDPPDEWQPYAAQAVASSTALVPADRDRSEGLAALADGRYPQACARYRQLIARDSLDVTAWFGLGDCQSRDHVVVRDPFSPSRWRFRASYHSAIRAYRRALELNPSIHLAFKGGALTRLAALLFTETNVFRGGIALAPDTGRFAAFPSLQGDTLAFVPYPKQLALQAAPPATQYRAIERNRDVLRSITERWVRAYPRSPDALELHALVLETLNRLEGTGSQLAALPLVQRSRPVAGSPEQGLRLATEELRLDVKLGRFARARLIADSLLHAWPAPTAEAAARLAGVAALTGHLFTAALLWQTALRDSGLTAIGSGPVAAPREVVDAALALQTYGAFGAPVESIPALERRIDRFLSLYVPQAGGRRELVRWAALAVPAVQAFPDVGVRPIHRPNSGFYMMDLQWGLHLGDTVAVRRGIAALDAGRQNQRPGDVAIDGTYLEASLLLQLGDTAVAASLLDASLDALSTLGLDLIDQMPQAAAVVRAMALRAGLAGRAGDRVIANKWAEAVVALWSAADDPLQPQVASVRALLEAGKQ